MKVRISIICLVAVFISACATGGKKVTQGINYSRSTKNQVTYEFSSAIPLTMPPSVIGEEMTANPEGENTDESVQTSGAQDEDFVAENAANSYSTYGDVVVTVSSRKFELGNSATRKEMAILMKSIETAYGRALRMYQPSGFTYAVSSVGASNPLSDVRVNCRMSERSANDNGQEACKLLFDEIRNVYMQLKEGKDVSAL